MTSDTETTTPVPMTPERLAEIREREQATIPGPWFVVNDQGGTLERWINSEDGTLQVCLGYLGNRTEDEAAFIAHARQDVPELVAEVERLRTELAAARKGKVESQLDRLDDWAGDLATVVAERDNARAEIEGHAEEIADLKRTAEFTDEALREAREDRDDALKEAERLRAERDQARRHRLEDLHAMRLALKAALGIVGDPTWDQIISGATQTLAERDRLAVERDTLGHQVSAVKQVRTWRNEDGRMFVFADDLRAALDGTEAS